MNTIAKTLTKDLLQKMGKRPICTVLTARCEIS